MRSEVEAAGFPFVGWCRAPTGIDADPADASGMDEWLHKVVFEPAGAYAADTLDEIQRLPTDAVLGLDLLAGCAFASEAANVPHAILSPHVSIRPLRGMLPVASGLTPPQTAVERSAVDAATDAILLAMERGRPRLNNARCALGLPPVDDAFAYYDQAERVLLAISQAFDFDVAGLPANYRFVGPLLDEPAWSREAPIAWLETQQPRILISGSTGVQNQIHLLRRITRAVGAVEAQTIVTTGPNVRVEDLAAPPHVRVVAAASHDALMAAADLVVCQGGHGTVSRALIHGVPLLVMPLARDQFGNAARIALRGAGGRLSAEASEAEIVAAVRHLLARPGFRKAAESLGAAVQADIDANNLVHEVEAMVTTRRCRQGRGPALGPGSVAS